MAGLRYREFPAKPHSTPGNSGKPQESATFQENIAGGAAHAGRPPAPQPRVKRYVLLSVRTQKPGETTITRSAPVRRS